MDAPKPTFRARLHRAVANISGTRPSAVQARYDEILIDAGRTQSLETLLVRFPDRVCAELKLASFDIFLRQGTRFTLKRTGGDVYEFPASGSTISRMKRERKPANFVNANAPGALPEAWQLLATKDEIATLTALQARVLLPLEGRTGLMGFVALAPQAGKTLTPTELEFLCNLGPQMGRGLETAQLVRTLSEEAVHRARVVRELELAREVQERLLPVELPKTDGLRTAAFYKSAEEVGGDYYDLFTQRGVLCCVVGDVSGKGISSALLMATLRATLRALMLEPLPAVEIVRRLNSQLYQASSMARYATFFFALYDPADCVLTYVNAGHNPPLLLHATGEQEHLTTGGAVLGLLPALQYEQASTPLLPGDRLILYTDGISESVDVHGQEWGEEGLLQALRGRRQQDAEATVATVCAALARFAAGAKQPDDITLVVLERV